MFGNIFHRKVYLIGIALVMCGLPASTVGVSVGFITMAINFLLSGEWKQKFQRLKQKPYVWVFVAMYFPILISGLLSQNHSMGFEIMRLWLPVLLIPPIVASAEELNAKEFKLILSLFILSTLVVTFIGAFSYFTLELPDARKVSPFISHIRLALMVNLAIAILFDYSTRHKEVKFTNRLLLVFLMVWFIFFLIILNSFTGILMLTILMVFVAFRYLSKHCVVYRFVAITGLAVVFFIPLSYVVHKYDSMYAMRLTSDNKPKQFTLNGNHYLNDTLSTEIENGYLVNINICDEELRKEWPKRSSLPYEGPDKKNQPLRSTLIRYLTSAGLTKDSAGLSMLDSVDIALVESGFTNTLFKKRVTGFDSRFYEFFYEIHNFHRTGTLTGGSVLRRILYASAAWHVIKTNPLFGVGYGDLPAAMNQFYDIRKIDLPQAYRFLPHNQYLTVWASAGIFGLIIFILSFTLPFFSSESFHAFPVKYFWVIVMVSMLFEDTMLTHIGISFVAVFSALFIFGCNFKATLGSVHEVR